MWHCLCRFCLWTTPSQGIYISRAPTLFGKPMFPFLCQDYALWFDIMFNFLNLLLQIPSKITWNTSRQVWRSIIWCEDREDRIWVYQLGGKPLEKETSMLPPKFLSSCKLSPKHPWALQPVLFVVWKIQYIAMQCIALSKVSGSCLKSFIHIHFSNQKEVFLNQLSKY